MSAADDETAGATIYDVATYGRRGSLRELPRLTLLAGRLLAAADRAGVAVLLGFALVSGALLAVEAFAARQAITGALDAYAAREGVRAVLGPVLVLLVAALASGSISAFAQGRQELLAERAHVYAQGLVLDAAVRADLAQFERPAFHDRLQRAGAGLHQPLNLVRALISSAQALLALAAAVVSLLVIEPVLAAAVPLAAVPVVVAMLRRGDAYYAFAFSMTPAERERGYLVSVLSDRHAAKEVRAFGIAPTLRARYERLTAARMRGLGAVLRTQLVAQVVASTVGGVLVAGLLLGMLQLALTGRLGLADLTVAAGLVTVVGQQVGVFGWAVSALWESALFLRDVTELARFTGPPGSPDPAAVGPGSTAGPATIDPRLEVGPLERLRAQGIGFGYPSSAQPVLHDIDLEIGAGEVVALVGENGSGKTTLATLIGGFYPPGTGRLTWNGVDTAALDPAGQAALREQVTVLFQDFVHYALSAHLNVGLGHPEAVDDPAAVRLAAGQAGADSVVDALSDGYDTLLAPAFLGGTDLSGGQWQRIALARALVRRASLVVLDEPTAALDPRAEHELFARIRSVFAGRAVLLVSHRFSTVREADRIYVLHEGRVVEHGTHAELMAGGGRYAELFGLQASAFG